MVKFYNAVLKGQACSKNHIFVLESSRVLRDMAMDHAILSGTAWNPDRSIVTSQTVTQAISSNFLYQIIPGL